MTSTFSKLHPKLKVIILQHPQEPKDIRSTGFLVHELLENSILKVGLSWKNLSAILKHPVQSSEWAVLYLGTQKSYSSTNSTEKPFSANPIHIASKNRSGNTKTYSMESCKQDVLEDRLKGIVVLDGTWAQAKTMWWRNPWLLKLKRITLSPPSPSAYGRIRKEPRKECLASIESVALVLELLEGNQAAADTLRASFEHFLQNFKKKPQD